MEQRDALALAELYDEECVVDSPTAGGPVAGREAIVQVYEAWFNAFPDAVLTFEHPVIDGHSTAQLLVSAGTGRGPFLGLPPTGKSFRIPMVFLTTMRNHLIVHERRIYDFTGMLVQIGVLKAKPA